jgi:uncharacterized membrane protein YtjA (UPF0391 family)
MKGTQKKTAKIMKEFLFDFFFLVKEKQNKWCACSARLDGWGTRDLSARMLIVNWSGKSGVCGMRAASPGAPKFIYFIFCFFSIKLCFFLFRYSQLVNLDVYVMLNCNQHLAILLKSLYGFFLYPAAVWIAKWLLSLHAIFFVIVYFVSRSYEELSI